MSCIDNPNTVWNSKIIGETIIYPDSLINIYNYRVVNTNRLISSSKKVVVDVNGNCPICIFEIYNWVDFQEEINKEDVFFIFIISATNPEQFINSFKGTLHNSIFVWDKYDQFLFKNNFLENIPNHDIFLLDSCNNIILFGSPFYSKRIKRKYLKELNIP